MESIDIEGAARRAQAAARQLAPLSGQTRRKALYAAAEEALRGEARVILLSTATKDFRRILHFYLEELGMDFWSARLFKEIGGGRPPDAGGKAREDTTG